ncbi:hypothetical protein A5678_25025 [Mycobacterium sp. E2733]|nr:hypothetical protein A5678_25025 [Mycobacterium sp. E2733]
MPNYLLSALQAINIQPGETAQLAHHDDGTYPTPRPRAPLAVAAIWAVDDFAADNGATVLIPAHLVGIARIARTVSGDILRMLGYSIHPTFIGTVDGLHPLRLLETMGRTYTS